MSSAPPAPKLAASAPLDSVFVWLARGRGAEDEWGGRSWVSGEKGCARVGGQCGCRVGWRV
ncbi:MAG: hypothetical protein ACKESB_02030 [Candidatus Hodgkinia cicadicola]